MTFHSWGDQYFTSADLAIIIYHIHKRNRKWNWTVGGKVNDDYRFTARERLWHRRVEKTPPSLTLLHFLFFLFFSTFPFNIHPSYSVTFDSQIDILMDLCACVRACLCISTWKIQSADHKRILSQSENDFMLMGPLQISVGQMVNKFTIDNITHLKERKLSVCCVYFFLLFSQSSFL